MEKLVIYIISDSLGETGEQVAKASIGQFNLKNYEIRKYPYVLDKQFLDEILNDAKYQNSIIVYTLVDLELANRTVEFCKDNNIPGLDLINPLINAISLRTDFNPLREPGIIRKLDEKYFKRVEAIEFAVKYDDGKDSRGLIKSDLVLVGISRTSKTPLSMYLANKNIKVANVPLVPEVPVPKELFEVSNKKIIGLTNTPEKLNQIRQERLKALGLSGNANYANMQRILEEIEYAENIMKKLGCPIIDVSNKAIEETAGLIINIMKENGLRVYKGFLNN
ncbi:MAG: kinase/pyrophosphorylase [Tepidibacter sp.]|jgi:regulator of PEP synthase PpsR (kinase-PPPase family)|uniref:pyruvate, water dikinase regulatory protein n=1 Tax=Tepidibacter sp. TaxID=2529387 RepID=UPI0025DA3D29|nr:pyruvate, water dikinase regulatory protein [Tepidibacter sp.]MCT4508057.1 kinase/pyrophosphorylase [Tepidibacter sp.]